MGFPRDIMEIVLKFFRSLRFLPLRSLPLVLALAAIGCHAQSLTAPESGAQQVQVGTKLTPELSRRIEVMIRSNSRLPQDAVINVGVPGKSEVPNYATVVVTFTMNGNTTKPIPFLLSEDGKTLAQMNKFDLSQDPKQKVSAEGRPARGGPPNAPVVIVGFDDLECPYCARMHAEIFPAILKRYGDKVRIVYRDFPLLEIHPWAMHAAVDANCLGNVSTEGYWNFVDYVHAHADEIAGPEKTAAKANVTLDKIALDEGARQKLDQAPLAACLQKQDDTRIKQSIAAGEAEPLHVDATPALFINGEKIDGMVPIETLYRVIDEALVAAGQTPPPPVPPASAPQPKAVPATKPGS
jgi:protein-disulfide isomerase